MPFHSNRYLGEWVLTMLASAHPQTVIPQIETAFGKATQSRLTAVPAFLSVFTQVALGDETNEMLERTIKRIIPWSMAQHFGTRLTAQVRFVSPYFSSEMD